MSIKKKLILGISLGVLTLAGVFYWINQTFFSVSNDPYMNASGGVIGPDGQVLEGEDMGYQVFEVMTQDPVTVDATIRLQTDAAYFYDASKGKIENILVKDGQSVKKGALLYTYVSDNKDQQYALEDMQREQTKLYNQREELIQSLADLTGQYYNYRGDTIAQYWGNDGKQAYYIVEEIGQTASLANGESQVEGQVGDLGLVAGGDSEGIKEQIRQVNAQIEELEIKLVRQLEGQNERVIAQTDGQVILNPDGQTNASVPLVRIISDKQSVVGSVTEYDFYALAEDRKVAIHIPAENRTVSGTIVSYDKIPAYAGTGSGTGGDAGGQGAGPSIGQTGAGATQFGFVVAPDESLQPGFSAKVNITLPGFVIPADAILEEGDRSFVFINQAGKAVKTEIELIQQGLQQVVLQGLSEGDQLVLFPGDLTDGQEIQVIEPMMFDPGASMEPGA
ncbi:TPA: hypothetical protein ACGO1T_000698 [Streptococcus suis]